MNSVLFCIGRCVRSIDLQNATMIDLLIVTGGFLGYSAVFHVVNFCLNCNEDVICLNEHGTKLRLPVT